MHCSTWKEPTLLASRTSSSNSSKLRSTIISSPSIDTRRTTPPNFLSSNRPTPKKTVSFSHIQIREYPIQLGDNPSCTAGPPISIGWDYYEKRSKSLDDYESKREQRRNERQLKINPCHRRTVLLRSGSTIEEIETREREMEQIKKQRHWSCERYCMRVLEERTEFVRRQMKQLRSKVLTEFVRRRMKQLRGKVLKPSPILVVC